jgi:hypothetical protein
MTGDPDMDRLSPQELELEQRLRDERPIPHPGFRSMLRNQLLSDTGRSRMQPRRLRLLVASYASGGLVLLAVAAVGVLGAGPLAT